MKRLFSAFCGALAMMALVFSASAALAESKGKIYCCAHCARQEGVRGVKDRAA